MKTFNFFAKAAFLAVLFGAVDAHPPAFAARAAGKAHKPISEPPSKPTNIRAAPKSVPLKTAPVKGAGVTAASNTTTVAAAAAPNALVVAAAAVAATNVKATVLVIARDTASAYSGWSGLNGYGIPYQILTVPQAGVTLPALNSSATSGNFGAIVVLSEVSYDYGGTLGFQSALTAAQWQAIYAYQVTFGVRLVRLDVFPSADSGTSAIGGCCNTGVEQLISITDISKFPTSGLKLNAGVSTQGLWHYPATITNATIATQFASFAATTGFPTASTAGVINNISGRQQLVFFIGFAVEWSSSSNYLQHAWITWVTRGLYTGYRRINLNTQIDDMFLESDIYSPAGTTFQVTTADLNAHKSWITTLNAKLNTGSSYFPEVAHNGNGNIEDSTYNTATGATACGIGPIEYAEQIDTPLEFQKPLGTGTNLWPSTPATYPYTTACTNLDALKTWWATSSNLNAFAHVSHTFTHEDQNNATFFDINREITWNQRWLSQVGISGASKFSPKGLVPPAITGLHNGDALRAWSTNGITQAVGDNTRPALLNPNNEHWPLYTTVAANGFAGIQITPRWATNIYYNCHLPACTVAEWKATAAGVGDWTALLALEKATNTRHLFGLHRDPFMFHQANLNYVSAPTSTINGVTAKYSLLQAWVETVAVEVVRLVNWPIISLKHDDFSVQFANRYTRDQCAPVLTYTTDPVAKTITGVTLTANGNTCAATIPVTVPGTVTSTQGFTTEKVGNDPLTIWAKLSGTAVTFTLSTPVPF